MRRTTLLLLFGIMLMCSGMVTPPAMAAETGLCMGEAETEEVEGKTEEFCPPEKNYPRETSIEATSSSSVFANKSWTVTCTSSNLLGNSGSELAGEPLLASITSLTFGGCTTSTKVSCTVKALGLPFGLAIKATKEEDGSATVLGGEAEKTWEIVCGETIKCSYSGEPALEMIGGAPASLVGKEETLSTTKKGCPETASWTVTYTIQAPQPVRPLDARPIVFCAESWFTCPADKQYKEDIGIKAQHTAPLKFVFDYKKTATTVKCDESFLVGKSLKFRAPLVAEISSLSFAECGTCGVKAERLSWRVEIEPGVFEGRMTWRSDGSGEPVFLITCVGLKCVYQTLDPLKFKITEGNPATFSATNQSLSLLGLVSDADCGGTATWSGIGTSPPAPIEYKFTEPKPLFVSTKRIL